MLAPGAEYIVKLASHSRLTALLLHAGVITLKCSLNACTYCIWWQFFRIHYREQSRFYIALSSFLLFQMVEILCSFVSNYSFFDEWTKALSRWGLISWKRFWVIFAVTFHSTYPGRRPWNKSCTRKLMKLYPFKLLTVITFRNNLLYEVYKTEVNVQSSPDVRWNL